MTADEQMTLQRWMSRALRAENAMRQGKTYPLGDDAYSDDEYLCITLRRRDESLPVHIDDLNAARERTGRWYSGLATPPT